MVKIKAVYEGDLHCLLTHGPSGKALPTDAPKDNMGKGEAFSPTDLSAASLLSCMLTTMGIYAKKNGIDLKGAEGEVLKEMSADAPRRIVQLAVTIRLPEAVPSDQRKEIERIGDNCPVVKSLNPAIRLVTSYSYGS